MLNKIIISALLLMCACLQAQDITFDTISCSMRPISNFGSVQFGSGKIYRFEQSFYNDQATYFYVGDCFKINKEIKFSIQNADKASKEQYTSKLIMQTN